MNNEVCHQHSGCLNQISNNKEGLIALQKKYDNMITKINVTLGGVAVTFIAIVINLIIELVKLK